MPAVGTEQLGVVVTDATSHASPAVAREAVATPPRVHPQLCDALVVVGQHAQVHLQQHVLHGVVARAARHAVRHVFLRVVGARRLLVAVEGGERRGVDPLAGVRLRLVAHQRAARVDAAARGMGGGRFITAVVIRVLS